MEREILFRGKRLDNGEWTCGSLLTYADGSCFICCEIYPGKLNKLQVDPSTVGQYTGLTDKNGTKIFEGDIVTGYFDHEKIIGTIVYGSDAQYYIDRSGLYGIYLDNAEDWIEVIGNKWDNPELLEVKR